MSNKYPYYLVHSYSQNKFGEKFCFHSIRCEFSEENGKTYILFNSRWYLVRGILPKITVNDEGRKLEFSVSLIDY